VALFSTGVIEPRCLVVESLGVLMVKSSARSEPQDVLLGIKFDVVVEIKFPGSGETLASNGVICSAGAGSVELNRWLEDASFIDEV
jgi:hypothetical protein